MSAAEALDVPNLVEAWCARDGARALLASDHAAIAASRPLRSFIVEELERHPDATGRDLLHSFAVLGRLMAEHGASPTLVAGTVDGALDGRPSPDNQALLFAARAAVVESYVHARTTQLADEALRGWEYPACAVHLPDGTIAVAAGPPDSTDGEALDGWAARAVRGVARSGARRIVAAGSDRVLLALEAACDVAGIELRTEVIAGR